MPRDYDYKIQHLEEYFGDAKSVRKEVEECKICGCRLIFGHLTDFDNLYVKESAHCPDCGNFHRKSYHIVN